MSRLCQIRRDFPEEFKVLEEAGFTSDSDITSLDRTDLHELFPGVKNLKIRYIMLNKIHPEQSAGTTSESSLRVWEKIKKVSLEAFTAFEKERCSGYLEFLDRMDLLELLPGVKNVKLRKEIFEIIQNSLVVSQPPESGTDHWKNKLKSKFGSFSISAPSLNPKEVWYQKLDRGKSPTVSNEVIKKVTSKIGVRFKDTTGDHKVSILLCPVISRIGSDAEAAITSINDKKPVILVFLIHSLKPQSVSYLKSWDDSKNIVLHTYLFHHETKSGLLRCKENDNAISDIQAKLLVYSQDALAPGEGS